MKLKITKHGDSVVLVDTHGNEYDPREFLMTGHILLSGQPAVKLENGSLAVGWVTV